MRTNPIIMKKNKNAFTLAEILITLTIVGVVVAVLVPSVIKITPNEEIMRFKSADNTLGTVIKELITSEKYFADNSFAKKADGNTTDGQYFCLAFADLVSAVTVQCGKATAGSKNKVKFSPADNIYSSDTVGDTPEAAGATMDSACENVKTGGNYSPQIVLANGIGIFEENSGYLFSDSTLTGTDSNWGLNLNYKIICIDIDPQNTSAKDTIFGYGLRVDGKLVPGKKAKDWLDKDIVDKE